MTSLPDGGTCLSLGHCDKEKGRCITSPLRTLSSVQHGRQGLLLGKPELGKQLFHQLLVLEGLEVLGRPSLLVHENAEFLDV